MHKVFTNKITSKTKKTASVLLVGMLASGCSSPLGGKTAPVLNVRDAANSTIGNKKYTEYTPQLIEGNVILVVHQEDLAAGAVMPAIFNTLSGFEDGMGIGDVLNSIRAGGEALRSESAQKFNAKQNKLSVVNREFDARDIIFGKIDTVDVKIIDSKGNEKTLNLSTSGNINREVITGLDKWNETNMLRLQSLYPGSLVPKGLVPTTQR